MAVQQAEVLPTRLLLQRLATTTTDVRVDAQAEAAQNKTYDASGTDSQLSPSTLDADEVLDYYVSHNTNLRRGITDEYQILENSGPLYTGGGGGGDINT